MAIGIPSDFSLTSPMQEELRNSRTPEDAWTAALWQEAREQDAACRIYIDGHRKPVYADKLIPRGLIGCSGKILGCRALVLLHDEQGHPRLATTHRGDQHLTMGLPPILARYQDREGQAPSARVIVDREGMAAPFLRDRKRAGPHRGDSATYGSI
jgi:hypothetical protein